MELRPYVDAVRHELALAAAAGGEDARELAERLTAPLESALRLALLDALSEAAAEMEFSQRSRGRVPSGDPNRSTLPVSASPSAGHRSTRRRGSSWWRRDTTNRTRSAFWASRW